MPLLTFQVYAKQCSNCFDVARFHGTSVIGDEAAVFCCLGHPRAICVEAIGLRSGSLTHACASIMLSLV